MAWVLNSASAALIAGPAEPIRLVDDGGWNWLGDRRAVALGDTLFIGTVASGYSQQDRGGDIQVTTWAVGQPTAHLSILHHSADAASRAQWLDDHDCPALAALPSGEVLAVYAQHDREPWFYRRRRAAGRELWSEEDRFSLPGLSRVGLPQLLYVPGTSGGKLWMIYRCGPSPGQLAAAVSLDEGRSWQTSPPFLKAQPGADGVPYAKVAADREGRIVCGFNYGHQVRLGNAVEAAILGLGGLTQRMPIFMAQSNAVTWMCDCAADPAGHVAAAYMTGTEGRFQYRCAERTGEAWTEGAAAFAGGPLHAVPNDTCTGLMSFNPHDVRRAVISANVDPLSGQPLPNGHWEIYAGFHAASGKWSWHPLTSGSAKDNIRPVVVSTSRGSVVLWLRGKMVLPEHYSMEVVGAGLESG
jgi:hypothetical protein